MAWKCEKMKNVIIRILEAEQLTYSIDIENSRIFLNLNFETLESADILISIDKNFIGFIGCFDKTVENVYFDQSLRLINLINSQSYFNDAYMYIAADYSIQLSGDIYFGNDSNINNDCINIIYNMLIRMINNMCTFDKAFKLVRLGYDTNIAYNTVTKQHK